MDSRGYWHESEELARQADDRYARERGSRNSNGDRSRPLFSVEIGEGVEVVKADGQGVLARFEAAEKNRVTLKPVNDTGGLYFRFAEQVHLRRSNGDEVRAQVWDFRGGKLILRTLAVGS